MSEAGTRDENWALLVRRDDLGKNGGKRAVLVRRDGNWVAMGRRGEVTERNEPEMNFGSGKE